MKGIKIKKKLIVSVFFLILLTPSVHIISQNDNWFNKPIFSDSWAYTTSKIAIDSHGDIIIVGTTYSKSYPLKNPFDSRTNFISRIFVSKFSSSGEMLWSSYLGEGDISQFVDFKVDESNDIIVTGYTNSNTSEFYSSRDYIAFSNHQYYSYNIFLANITVSGQVAWFTIIGGESTDYSTAMDLDSSQNIVIVGETSSASFPLMNSISSFPNEYNTPIMLRISSNGSMVFSTYLSYLDDFSPIGINVNQEDNLLILGSKTRGSYSEDFFLLKINSSYNLLWRTELFAGIDYEDSFNDMLVDNSSNIYLFGTLSNEEQQTTYTDYEDSYVVYDYDQYLIKVNNSGLIEWTKRMGGINREEGTCIDLNNNQDIILGGTTLSSDYPVSVVNASFHGGADFTVAMVTNSGSIAFSNMYGGDAYEKMNDLVYDEENNRILALITSSTKEYGNLPLMIIELSSSGTLVAEISFAESTPLATQVTQFLFLLIAGLIGIGFLLFFTGYINKDRAGNAVITHTRKKLKGKGIKDINFIERLSYCPNDNTKMFSRTDRTIQTSEFTVTRNINVSLQNAMAMKKIAPNAIQTITPIAEEIFNQYPDIFDIQMVALECSLCKFAGAAPKRLPQTGITGSEIQIHYQEPEQNVQFGKRWDRPNIQTMLKIYAQSLTLESQKLKPLLNKKDTIYLVYLILGVFTLVQTTFPEVFELRFLMQIIFEYFQNLIFMLVITFVLWSIDKKIQFTMPSHELLKLIGLNLTIGIIFSILSSILLEYVPVREINTSLFIIIQLLPVIMILIVLSHHIGTYTDQPRLFVLMEIGILGLITSVVLTLLFLIVAAFMLIFGIFL